MQDTHTEVTTSRDHRSSNDTNRLARALGSTRVRQAAAAEEEDDGSASMPAFLMGGAGTTIRLLQKNSKGKASVRALVVPETARIAQQTENNTSKEEEELAARNKMFILESQLAEQEGQPLVAVHMAPRPLLPGQHATAAVTKTHSGERKETRKINSRAKGLSNEHLSQFHSSIRPGGGMRFAKRGFGNSR